MFGELMADTTPAPGPSAPSRELTSGGVAELSAAEHALLGAIHVTAADLADVFAHGADVVGGLFL